MADPRQRLAHNVAGDFWVDASCIDCDTCRWLAPEHFGRREDQASVIRQPTTPAERLRAEMALLSCPSASIGTSADHDLAAARAAFPEEIVAGVHHCGFHDRKSYGAAAYLLRRPAGNVLFDLPRFTRPLIERIEALGGVARIVMSHRDDVGDHRKWARHFGAPRLMHRADAEDAGIEGLEDLIDGEDARQLAEDLLIIPTPGHSRGSISLLVREEVLLSGDHIAFSRRLGHLYAFRDYCWGSWEEVRRSVEKLKAHRFSWVLPGHGRRFQAPAERMPAELDRCLAWMATVA